MSDGLKSAILTLENCETIEIPRKFIGEFALSGVEKRIERLGCNYIGAYETAKFFMMEVFKGADVPRRPFGFGDEESTFDRLTKYADVTHVALEFDDGTRVSYAVDYDEGENEGVLGADNVNQKTYVSSLGNLYLLIGEGKALFDFFDRESIEDAEETGFRADMYDVGVDDEPEHEWKKDDLPEFYRYVQLTETDADGVPDYCTAVRVPDPKQSWTLIFESPAEDGETKVFHFPEKWSYFNSKISGFIEERNERNNPDFTLRRLKERFPQPNSPQ